MESVSYVVGHYCAANDRNGNPRRCFVLYRVSNGYGHPVAVKDEGYDGDDTRELRAYFAKIEAGAKDAALLPRVKVSAMEYRAFLHSAPATPTRLDERD